MNLPRQPQPIELHLQGEPLDVAVYANRIKSWIEHQYYDTVTIVEVTNSHYKLTIHPQAVND